MTLEVLRNTPARWRWVAGVGVSSVLLVGLLWLGDPAAVWEAMASARPQYLLVAATLYGGVLTARWVRLAGLVDPEVRRRRLPALLWVASGHSFANQLLPARTGELTFPALWSRATDTNLGQGAVYLTAVRLVELGVLIPLYVLGFGLWLAGSDSPAPDVWGLAALAGIGVAIVVALPAFLGAGVTAVGWLLHRPTLSQFDTLGPLREAVPNARRAVDALAPGRRLWLVATTLAMWVGMFGVFYALLASCGVDLGITRTVVGAGGGIVGNLLPVGGIGSMGSMEAGWTAAFNAVGAPTAPVVAAALLLRGLILVGTGAATAAGVVWDRTNR